MVPSGRSGNGIERTVDAVKQRFARLGEGVVLRSVAGSVRCRPDTARGGAPTPVDDLNMAPLPEP